MNSQGNIPETDFPLLWLAAFYVFFIAAFLYSWFYGLGQICLSLNFFQP